ncbi:MAG TPA: ABC transporter permease [Bacteroidetes bacterium]|nr:ABC transporter permease [Bacteroidota bacterium]
MTSFRDIVRMALGALRGNGLRSMLTVLGITVGVFSVIAAVTAVAVLEGVLTSNLLEMGSQTITITRRPQQRESTDEERRRPQLTLEHAERLADRATLAASVSPSVRLDGRTLRGGGEETDPNITLVGADGAYAANNGLAVSDGRFLEASDVTAGRSVVVIGTTVLDELFSGREALGKEVRIDGLRFTVIGVLEEESGGFGMFDPNRIVFVPISRAIPAFGLGGDDVQIDVRAPAPELVAATRDETIGILRAIRGLTPEAENDFEAVASDGLAEGLKGFSNALAMGGAGVGLIALLAAGVGVMNVMLVSVTERTREIGVRKSLGAKRRDILVQFLLEAVVLCQMGGLVGIGLGVLAGNGLAAVFKSAPAFPVGWAIVAVVGVTVVALTFGVYPAIKASRLRPVEALRFE